MENIETLDKALVVIERLENEIKEWKETANFQLKRAERWKTCARLMNQVKN